MSDGSALPELHAGWLEALTGIAAPPAEPAATCSDCVMCAPVARSGTRAAFRPDVKCCTYVPHLSNVVAGRALRTSGRRSVEERIARRRGVTPLGLGLSHEDLRRAVAAQSGFGREDVVRCPHLDPDAGGCGIWGARNAVCSTWFCRHERGAGGLAFWHAVRDLLIAVEEQVAQYCLRVSGLPEEQLDAVLRHRATMREAVRRANAGEPLPDPVEEDPDEAYALLWGDWSGREVAWFEHCADLAEALGGDPAPALVDVAELVEAVGLRRAELARRALPERLRFTPGPGSEATRDVLRLVGYSPFDPVVVAAGLEPSLWELDGRRLPEVRAGLAAAGMEPLDDDLLRRLLDARLAEAHHAELELPDRVIPLDRRLGVWAPGAALG